MTYPKWSGSAAGLGFRVATEREGPVADALDAILGGYPPRPIGPTRRFVVRLDPPRIQVDGRCWQRVDRDFDLVPVLERELYAAAFERLGDRLRLHAAALERQDGAGWVLLAGASGAGKSTTALELVARGWRYMTDEAVAVGPKGGLLALRRFPQVEEGAPVPPEFQDLVSVRTTGTDGRIAARTVVRLPPGALAPAHGRILRAIVLLERGAGNVRAVGPAETATRLWTLSNARDPAVLLSLCRRTTVVEVAARSAAETASLVHGWVPPQIPGHRRRGDVS